MAAGRSMGDLALAIRKHRPQVVSVLGQKERDELLSFLSGFEPVPEILIGFEGLMALATQAPADRLLSALVGAAGLLPTAAALKASRPVALANKESLVLGGELIMPAWGHLISPVDSEHSAIFQILGGKLQSPNLSGLILTASGGPFRGYDLERLKGVTVKEALSHPSWSMGPKVSVDSATLMNKGLEVIEAYHLFSVPYSKISVRIHPGSTVHSLARFCDGSILAQLGPNDMRLPIAYALSYPERWPLLGEAQGQEGLSDFSPAPFPESLFFEEPDRKTFKALALAEAAGECGGTAPAILNGANEEAVSAFLSGRLDFLGIADTVEECLDKIPGQKLTSLEAALAADGEARIKAREIIGRRIGGLG
jgi:1-deoxy-D-xylulose-5-phosphate reductoisomerase